MYKYVCSILTGVHLLVIHAIVHTRTHILSYINVIYNYCTHRQFISLAAKKLAAFPRLPDWRPLQLNSAQLSSTQLSSAQINLTVVRLVGMLLATELIPGVFQIKKSTIQRRHMRTIHTFGRNTNQLNNPIERIQIQQIQSCNQLNVC